MFKKLITFIMIVVIIIGLGFGIYYSINNGKKTATNSNIEDIFANVQNKQIEVTEFFTYGKCFNFSGTLSDISKDNFESAKLYISNGEGFEKTYNLEGQIDEKNLKISTTNQINKGLNLDELANGQYVILVRLKMNNSVNPKYYSLKNISDYKDIEYYTVTKENSNKKISINFKNDTYNNHEYAYLNLDVTDSENPENVYDIVIDAGHGGKDIGEKSGSDTEANISLLYSKLLKEKLDTQGLKVKLTRDDTNSETYTATNMYDENGRITIACQSNAKLMISLHINNGNKGLRGLEIYCPSKANLDFAQNIANNIVNFTDIEYSNNNSFKKAEGVYVRNFTQSVINDYTSTAKKKGYEPYNLTLDTPYLFTIREVGGIATNAYVDGRNTDYSANKYYNSNKGIECYQIEMGYIKNDLEVIKTQMEQYVTAICESVIDNY